MRRTRARMLALRACVPIVLVGAAIVPSAAQAQATQPWLDPSKTPEERVAAILPQLTLAEKVDLMTGDDPPLDVSAYFNKGIPRLGIPELRTADIGPGVRIATSDTTYFPMGIALAATWNPSLMDPLGKAVASEARATRHNMILGPNVDIARNPWWGRVAESFGEDPLLSRAMASAFIQAAQNADVPVSLKHYALYSQETNSRNGAATPGATAGGQNVQVTERALREVYLPAWEDAAKAGVASVMCAFPRINGVYACQNSRLQNELLRGQFGFDGFILSDYGATHDTEDSAEYGLDQETGTIVAYGPALLAAVQARRVSQETVDYHVANILRAYFRFGVVDNPLPATAQRVAVEEHGGLAREIADESITLLKNSNTALPLNAAKLDSIAVIGGDANYIGQESGAGAVANPTYRVSALAGIKSRAGDDVRVNWTPGTDPAGPWSMLPGPATVPSSVLSPPGVPGQSGLRAEYFNNTTLSGTPATTRVSPTPAFDISLLTQSGGNAPLEFPPSGAQSVRFTGDITAPVTGDYQLSASGFGDAKVYLDGTLIASFTKQVNPKAVLSPTIRLQAGVARSLRVEYAATTQTIGINPGTFQLGWTHPDNALTPAMRDAVAAARSADVAVIVARPYEAESVDRGQLRLPNDIDQLVSAVSAVNSRTVVVLESGGPIPMPWLGQVPAVLQEYYNGQEQGRALADVLFGDVSPSGKLPVSYPRYDAQAEAIGVRNPIANAADLNIPYADDIFVGYKGYIRNGTALQFPFGFGLSYTRFNYANLEVTATDGAATASFRVRNIGARTGRETAQVYVGKLPTSVETPARLLAGFAKVQLEPGEGERVSVTLDPRAFRYWNTETSSWVTPVGRVPIYVGTSSADAALVGSIAVPQGGFTVAPTTPTVSAVTVDIAAPVAPAAVAEPKAPNATAPTTTAADKVAAATLTARISCKTSKTKRLACTLSLPAGDWAAASAKQRTLTVSLVKGKLTFAEGIKVLKAGKVSFTLKPSRKLVAGKYTLKLAIGGKTTTRAVRVTAKS